MTMRNGSVMGSVRGRKCGGEPGARLPALDLNPSAKSLDPVAKSPQPGLADGALVKAVAVVGDRDTQPRVVGADGDGGLGRGRMLEDIGEPFGNDEVGRTFYLGCVTCIADGRLGVDADANRHPGRHRVDRFDQAPGAQHGRMDSACQRSKVGESVPAKTDSARQTLPVTATSPTPWPGWRRRIRAPTIANSIA